jgi:hypothetical protein
MNEKLPYMLINAHRLMSMGAGVTGNKRYRNVSLPIGMTSLIRRQLGPGRHRQHADQRSFNRFYQPVEVAHLSYLRV